MSGPLPPTDTLGGNIDWRWTTPRPNGSFSLRLGADAASNRVHIQLIEENPVDPGDATLNTDVRSPSYDVAGYALADLRIDEVTFSGGFRYDYIHIPFQDVLDPTADTTNSFSRLSPQGRCKPRSGPGSVGLWVGRPKLPRSSRARAGVC